MEKRGQQMTLGTIILIVLGIAVLVLLIFGFTTGWTNFMDRITNFGGGKANFDTIQQSCALACTTAGSSNAAYCSTERTVKYGKTVTAWSGDEVAEVKSSPGSCNEFATESPNYFPGLNVAKCPAAAC